MSQPLRLAVLTCGRPMAFFCIFFYINIFLLPFYQKNKKENVAATYPNGAVLSRHTHVALHNEGNGLRDCIYPK